MDKRAGGIVRKIDDLGRIVVPAETRKQFHINERDELMIAVDEATETIIMRKVDAVCTFCGSNKGVHGFGGKGICQSCADDIAAGKWVPTK